VVPQKDFFIFLYYLHGNAYVFLMGLYCKYDHESPDFSAIYFHHRVYLG
jgi:hypothetical protein